MNTTIHPTDVVTVVCREGSRQLYNFSVSGVDSMSTLFRQVRSRASEDTGVVKVIIRNNTRGWSQQHTLVFKSDTKPQPLQPSSRNFMDYPRLF
ncbi:MAG: hypothetical protein NC339_05050 [Muribaculaceae bacterium]|nr:hypothetical protein [Muribaculaceae bacterium]MCM1293830.1 hypothetical protein [Bacteroides sp.]